MDDMEYCDICDQWFFIQERNVIFTDPQLPVLYVCDSCKLEGHPK